MTDPEGDAECPDEPAADDVTAEPPMVRYGDGRYDRFARALGFSDDAAAAMRDAVRDGMAQRTAILSPLEQQCVALREFYLALRKSGFTQDEAFDYLQRQQQ